MTIKDIVTETRQIILLLEMDILQKEKYSRVEGREDLLNNKSSEKTK